MKILADVSHPKYFDKKNSTTFPLNCAQCGFAAKALRREELQRNLSALICEISGTQAA